ncbi:outer membrane protein insertion porin family [Planctomicrobium piriforme]|uniref:Outer membrane protein insertion porin family n=1 Tax=Planctomicrobium piriforme TaxID=1576369 RepID=A0A1I3HTZ3_9PLAN|nr:outer membrane protein insertion porin family [Planctomicrobium piriforme]
MFGSAVAVWIAACASVALAQRPFPGAAPASQPAPVKEVPKETPAPAAKTPVKTAAAEQPKGETKLPTTSTPRRPGVNNSLSNITPTSGIRDENVTQTELSIEKLLDDPLADVIIEGNDTIRTDAILRYIQCRPGRAASSRMVQQDVTQLLNTRWFYSVQPVYRSADEGPVLVFKVVEKPILRSVTFRGNKKIKTGELEAHTGLRPNHAYDVSANRESVYRIRQLYHDKGYRFAEVTLAKGESPEDRDVIFDIVEGPKSKIWGITFDGNEAMSDGILKTKISSKIVKLWIIQGDYDPEIIRNDVLSLKQYYMSLGYFDVDVQSEEKFNEDKSKVTVAFTVKEGQRYKVDGIEVIGNDVIARDKLMSDLKLKSGDFFNERFLKEDVNFMTEQYDDQGRLFAKVLPTPRFRDGDEAVVDLVYEIDEDVPRYIGTINVHIRGDYPHSQEEVVRQQVNRFLKPGKLARSSDLRMAQARVNGSGLWDKEEAAAFDIKPVDGTEYWPQFEKRGQNPDRDDLKQTSAVWETSELDRIFGHSPVPVEFPAIGTLAQAEEPATQALPPVPRKAARPIGAPPAEKPAAAAEQAVAAPFEVRQAAPVAAPVALPAVSAPVSVPTVMPDPDMVFRGQSEAPPVYRPQSVDAYGLPVPQNYIDSVSPQGDPFGDALSAPPPGFVDVNIDVTEGRTGRLMFGVGVNSDAGVVGSLVLQEDNFDIMRPPTSWSDIINGTAWRGAGQSFRLEAVPGNQVSRYMVSWNDPYFMRSDFSLGLNAFYYNRYYEYWTEDRLGGRASLGYVLDKYWSVSTALRLEQVRMSNYPLNPPQALTEVQGDNFLSTGSATLTYDARDNSFMPTRGNFASFSFEQGFGEFTYPRFDVSASQFFTVYERPDGFGKQILSFTGQLGYTGNQTPVFERYFAGGYSSFRGFYFRGVSPVQNGVKVGGDFMAVGSAEYMVPLVASDAIRTVVFTDFGTVNPNVSLDDFRVSAGFGFRLTIPAMGPAPLAFDFAWPVLKEDTDRLRVFSFYVGFTR